MYRCLEIILLIFLVRAANVEAKIIQANQVSEFVHKNVEQTVIFFCKN